MAWNEPGGGKRDPWGGGNGDQGPPDLDEVVKNIQKKLGGLFGGGKRGSGSSSGPSLPGKSVMLAVGVIALLLWLSSGFYVVEPAERGVVLRFGAFKEVTQPGLNWRWPAPIETQEIVNVDEFSSFRRKAQMLTSDENIVDVELTVQSRVQDPADFLFQDANPEATMRAATETAVREVIGRSELDFIMTEGRSRIASDIKGRIEALMKHYRTGLEVTSVNMQPAKPPEQVKAAFDDAIKAREDKERLENEADAYAKEIVPKARGAAARRREDSKAYKAKVIADAEGETARFLSVLVQYHAAPEVTRERMYIDTIEDVMRRSRKVLLDDDGSGNLTLLPLDKLMQGGQGGASSESLFSSMPSASMGAVTPRRPTHSTSSKNIRDVTRERSRSMR
ncbi:MAG TPA: FtsH protease activity modulator HflK [Chromatiaceae bacterium]|nr:FtsH protease activity modulator HflK [Chromatiaceae bacterium]